MPLKIWIAKQKPKDLKFKDDDIMGLVKERVVVHRGKCDDNIMGLNSHFQVIDAISLVWVGHSLTNFPLNRQVLHVFVY